GGHIAMTGLSVVAIKQIESTRIGLSYLETSSRYRMFDQRVDGRWPYVRPAEFSGAAMRVYERIMDRLFATYSALIEPLTADLMKLYPAAEGLSDKGHAAAIRAKAADVLRALLPIGHTSSLGIYGNGRAFEYLLLKMASSELAEVRDLERELYDALMQVIPNFVKRAHTDRGVAYSGYLSGVRRDVRQRARLAGLQPLGSRQHGVVFVHSDPDAENKVAAGVLYGDCQRPLAELEAYVRRLPMESRNAILRDGVSGRANRYQRVPRAFERAEYDLEITANWGVFKDLARHRMATPFTSLLTPLHGYQIPDELVGTHYEGIVSGALDEVTPAWMVLNEVAPVAAQYCVPMAMKFRYSVHTSLRQLSHLVELRSTIQGHR